jgi:hypothetical protein
MAPTSGDYEAQANRLRSKMGQTVGELRVKSHALNPCVRSSVACRCVRTFVARSARFCEHASSGPTAIAGFGVAMWLLAAACKRNKQGAHDVTLPLRESSSSLVDTATRVFRDRAATKQRDKLEDVINRVSGPSNKDLSALSARWFPNKPCSLPETT